MTRSKKEYYSVISNVIHISESEVALAMPDYNGDWTEWNETYTSRFKGVLFDLGLDVSQHYELQEATQHRNRLNQVVTCGRIYGTERSDNEWLNSGYASAAALDKAKNSRMLDDLYKQKALTIDTQMALEARDKYNVVEEDNEHGEE